MRSKYSLIIKHCTITYNYLSLNNHLCNSTYPKITEINVIIIKLKHFQQRIFEMSHL